MRHRLHTEHVATSFEIDGLQMLRSQPGRADDLLLGKQLHTRHVDIAVKLYRFSFEADLLESFGVVSLRLRRIVRYEEHSFALKRITRVWVILVVTVSLSTCPVRWCSSSMAPGKISGKFQSTPSQSNRNVS